MITIGNQYGEHRGASSYLSRREKETGGMNSRLLQLINKTYIDERNVRRGTMLGLVKCDFRRHRVIECTNRLQADFIISLFHYIVY